MSSADLEQFLSHDFSKDEKFQEYLQGLEFSKYPAGNTLKKLQMKFYCRNVNRSANFANLWEEYLNKESGRTQQQSSTGASQQQPAGYSSNTSSSPQSSTNAPPNAFIPYSQSISHLTPRQKALIILLQFGVLVLGPISLFIRRAYTLFCLLTLVTNAITAFHKSKSLKSFFTVTLQTEERAHYMVLAMIMMLRPHSIMFIALMMIMALFDVLDYSPDVIASHPLYQRVLAPKLAILNANRTQWFTVRIPMIEIMLCLGSILEMNILRIIIMLNLLVMRYINSHNLRVTIDGLMRVIDTYAQRVPSVYNGLLFVKKYVGMYVDRMRVANDHLKQL